MLPEDEFATVSDPLLHQDPVLFPTLEKVTDCRVNALGELEYLCHWGPGRARQSVVDPSNRRFSPLLRDHRLLYGKGVQGSGRKRGRNAVVRNGRPYLVEWAPHWCVTH